MGKCGEYIAVFPLGKYKHLSVRIQWQQLDFF
ncbi:Hypothetical protein Minf_1307 [Methylacidiphilum infernorum V4]|uniref:Uncharacterized protein n=1 Tax=Methylacidiphilum infernorum (isolate V4) TaxID=481448 RepID=B3DVK8_METI4|nr:Hypothetical protein Minf_1307 [Methylacidiphilum infernorum V4]